MQPAPNRLGLGLRPPLPSYGQGPSISALAQQQQMHHGSFVPPQPKSTTLFIGSISGGITDAFLNTLLGVRDLANFPLSDINPCVVHRLAAPSLRSSVLLHRPTNHKDLVSLNFKIPMAHCELWRYSITLNFQRWRMGVSTKNCL